MKKHLLLIPLLLISTAGAQSLSGSGQDFRAIDIQVQGSRSEVRVGQLAEVARFRVSNRTGRNLTFDSLRLRNFGNSDLTESFDNVFITTTTNEVLADLVGADRKHWDWKFREGIELRRGDSISLSVKARLIRSRRGRNIQLGIRRVEDLLLIDNTTGFAVACNECEGLRFLEHRLDTGGIIIDRNSGFRASRFRNSSQRTTRTDPTQGRPITILGTNNSSSRFSSRNRSSNIRTFNRFQDSRRAQLARRNLSRRGPILRGSQSFSPGAREVVFFSSGIDTRQGAEVDGLFLALGSGSFVADKDGDGRNTTIDDIDEAFGDWRLFVNGQNVGSSNDFERRNGQIGVLFNNSFSIPSNSRVILVGRVRNSAQTGDRVRFSLGRDGLLDPVYSTTGNRINQINGGGVVSPFSSTR